jgi:dienelactone hydrolase
MNLHTGTMEYQCNETAHRGYLALDQDIEEKRPGILVVHEWWGVNAYMQERVEMLARQGFCALAIDMYGGGYQASNPDEAGAAMNAVLSDMTVGTERLRAGYDALLSLDAVDSGKTAAIGYCFGGAMALHMARIGMPLSVVASFHGALGSFHKPGHGEINARILVCHGGADQMVTMDDLAAFRTEMDEAGASYEVIVHEGAQHGFSSKGAYENGRKYGIPVGYDATADAESWGAMMGLFQSVWNP